MIKKSVITRRIMFLLILIWLGVIYWFSSRTAVQSGQSSAPITNAIMNIFRQDSANASLFLKIEFFVRKSAHLFLFVVLGFLSTIYFSHFEINKKLVYLFSVLLCLASGMFDEIHQLFVVGRACRVFDMFVDTLGGIIGTTIVVIFLYIKTKKAN